MTRLGSYFPRIFFKAFTFRIISFFLMSFLLNSLSSDGWNASTLSLMICSSAGAGAALTYAIAKRHTNKAWKYPYKVIFHTRKGCVLFNDSRSESFIRNKSNINVTNVVSLLGGNLNFFKLYIGNSIFFAFFNFDINFYKF